MALVSKLWFAFAVAVADFILDFESGINRKRITLGLLSFFRGVETKSFNLSDWSSLIDFGAQTASEILVSPLRAEECQTFNTGKRIRCETLGTLSLKIYKREGQASLEATEHPLYRLLHDRPNPWTSAAAFIMQLEADTIMYGNGFAFANRVDGAIHELIRLNPLCVVVLYDVVTLEPSYQVSLQDGSQKVYPWQDILHIPSPNGLAAVKTAREAIGLSIALEKHAAKILGNGARPSGVLKAKGKLNDTAYDRLKKSWKMNNGGENAGGTAILEDGTDFIPLAFNSVDLQFNEMRQFQVIEIGRALGIPPTLLFELGRATWANSEEMGQTFLSFTVLGRCKLWEGAIARLLTADEQKEYFAEFLTDSLVRADISSRFAAFSQACGGPWLSPNEVRGIDNRGTIKDGDTLRPPANASGVSATPSTPAKAKPPTLAVA